MKRGFVVIIMVAMIVSAAFAEEIVVDSTPIGEEILIEEEQIVPQEETQYFEGYVSVYVSCQSDIWYGDAVTLYVVLKGYEGVNYHIQWQVSKDNCNWQDISGENGEHYIVTVTEENCADYYRVMVTT